MLAVITNMIYLGGESMQTKLLANGVEMPFLGLGVYKMRDKEETITAITTALELGYRSIDTAAYYFNEKEVGEAIKRSHIPREDIFITTKVWNDDQGYDQTLRAFENSLKLLDLDYIDLYLTHWPVPGKFTDTYQAIERLYEEKLIRVPGVSNHHQEHILEIENTCNIKPMVNQIESHPYFQQNELISFCKERHIAVTSWAPLSRGKVLDDELIKRLALKHNKTSAQIVLRWHFQRGTVVIPKSVTPSRIKENSNFFDFVLTEEDMVAMSTLERNGRTGANPDNPNFMSHFNS